MLGGAGIGGVVDLVLRICFTRPKNGKDLNFSRVIVGPQSVNTRSISSGVFIVSLFREEEQ